MKKHILTFIFIFITYCLIAQNASSVWSELQMTHSDAWNLADSIEKYRTGVIVVKTKPNTSVELEQQKHEFWFGSAVTSAAFDGSLSEEDAMMYKQKFNILC